MLTSLPTSSLFLWALSIALNLLLFLLIVLRSRYRLYPFFSAYLAINLLQTAVGLVSYSRFSFFSEKAYFIGWLSQAVVVLARTCAAGEICYRALGAYRGIWALASRIILACAFVVLGLALYFGRHGYETAFLTGEIGCEAFIATGIAGLFIFARYYEVLIPQPTSSLGMALGLFSCFKIVNDVILENALRAHPIAWNNAGMVAFVAALVIWIAAVRQPAPLAHPQPRLSPVALYELVMPQVNKRLADLNEHLIQFWDLDSQQP